MSRWFIFCHWRRNCPLCPHYRKRCLYGSLALVLKVNRGLTTGVPFISQFMVSVDHNHITQFIYCWTVDLCINRYTISMINTTFPLWNSISSMGSACIVLNKSDIKRRNTLGCSDQYMCRELRLCNRLAREAAYQSVQGMKTVKQLRPSNMEGRHSYVFRSSGKCICGIGYSESF